MPKAKILIVEDDRDIAELIQYNLAKEGYTVVSANNGEKGFQLAKSSLPDLIVLDLMLPGMDGLEVCKLLKAEPKTQGIPVVMLTAKSEESDVVTGLELGAEDYIAKPFSPKILVARLRTVLRRKQKKTNTTDETLKIHDLVINPGRHELLIAGKPVDLTFTEFKMLQLLAARPGWVFSRYQILEAVRGVDYSVTDRAVDVQIVGLRKKLGRAGRYIETVRGVGYRFQE
ncbi:MAG: response regulator transcription factor [Candidatus Firestonebacteria bacterium]|nr:response regulator transcription factor [Candidatus Firestonebacteria bacterium]